MKSTIRHEAEHVAKETALSTYWCVVFRGSLADSAVVIVSSFQRIGRTSSGSHGCPVLTGFLVFVQL